MRLRGPFLLAAILGSTLGISACAPAPGPQLAAAPLPADSGKDTTPMGQLGAEYGQRVNPSDRGVISYDPAIGVSGNNGAAASRLLSETPN